MGEEWCAARRGMRVTGVTISQQQLEYARARLERAGDALDGRFMDAFLMPYFGRGATYKKRYEHTCPATPDALRRSLSENPAQGMPYGRSSDPAVVRIQVMPAHRLLGRRQEQQFAVLAHYSDGSIADVTRAPNTMWQKRRWRRSQKVAWCRFPTSLAMSW